VKHLSAFFTLNIITLHMSEIDKCGFILGCKFPLHFYQFLSSISIVVIAMIIVASMAVIALLLVVIVVAASTAARVRATFVAAALLMEFARPHNLFRPTVVRHVDLAQLRVIGVNWHPAHCLRLASSSISALLRVVLGSPIIWAIVPHHWPRHILDDRFSRLVSQNATSSTEQHIFEGSASGTGANPAVAEHRCFVSASSA